MVRRRIDSGTLTLSRQGRIPNARKRKEFEFVAAAASRATAVRSSDEKPPTLRLSQAVKPMPNTWLASAPGDNQKARLVSLCFARRLNVPTPNRKLLVNAQWSVTFVKF